MFKVYVCNATCVVSFENPCFCTCEKQRQGQAAQDVDQRICISLPIQFYPVQVSS